MRPSDEVSAYGGCVISSVRRGGRSKRGLGGTATGDPGDFGSGPCLALHRPFHEILVQQHHGARWRAGLALRR